MEHLVFILVLALVLALIGRGLWWVTARAVLLPRDGRPMGFLVLPVAAPALAYAIACMAMLSEMAGDPTAGNLWPLAIGFMVFLWLLWAGAAGLVAWIVRRARHA